MKHCHFGPAISKEGVVAIKIGTLYDVHHYSIITHKMGKSNHPFFLSPILILDIEKATETDRIDGKLLPNEHKVKILLTANNKIENIRWSSGDFDCNFHFKEIINDEN